MIGPVVCFPVLKRYDLLRESLLSLRDSTRAPSAISIVDNGCGKSWGKLAAAFGNTLKVPFEVKTPHTPMGVAESWNYFLATTPDDRVIANDDILFSPRSLERLQDTAGDLVLGFGFSCFLIRDSCVGKVGTFDENISPGYAYFEDCDYQARIWQACDCGDPEKHVHMVNAESTDIAHGRGDGGSLTYRAGTPAEIDEHWRRFDVAKQNYIRKWGMEHHILERVRAARLAQRERAKVAS